MRARCPDGCDVCSVRGPTAVDRVVNHVLGGRPRRLGSDTERARLNVTRAIRTAIARIRDRAPRIGAHLDDAVRTGTHCSYRPRA
jgi:hypothetical protein